MQKPFLVLLALLTAVIMVGCTPSSPSATPSALPEVSGGDAENTVTPDPVLTPEPGFSPAAGTSLFDFSALSVSFFDLSAYGFAAPEYSVTDNTLVLNISGEASYGVINMQLSAGDSIKNAMSLASDSDYMRIRIENTGESDANIAVLLVTADGKSGCLNPAGAQLITLAGKKEAVYTDDSADVDAANQTGETHLCIPAGFSGFVYYPLTGQVPWWEGTVTDGELAHVIGFSLDIRFSNAADAQSISLSDFCLAPAE